MPRFSSVAWLLAFGFVLTSVVARAQESKPDGPAQKQADDSGDTFEDPADPIEVKTARTTGEADRIKAAALFAHGRVLIQRGDLDGALRRMQRAWRYDPDLVPIWNHIVPLARRTERFDELGRYAVLAAESDPKNPDLMVQLAAIVADRGELERAAALYEAALDLSKDDKLTVDRLVTYWETARLNLLAGNAKEAAKHSHFVQSVLENPTDHNLKEKDVAKLLEDPSKTYRLFAESYLQAGEFADAEANYKKVFADDEPQLTFQQARILAKKKKHDEALAKLDEYFAAKSLAAGPAPYRLLSDVIDEMTEDDDEADKRVLKKLVELQKQDASNVALGNLTAHQLLAKDRTDDAVAIFKELFQLDPTDSGYVGLIDAYSKLNQVKPLLEVLAQATGEFETLERFSSATEKISKNEKLLNELADLAKEQKDSETPIEHAALAIAWIALQADRVELADELFEIALGAKDANKSELLMRYGLKMYIQEHHARAQELLRTLLKEKINKDTKEQAYFYLSRSLERDGKTDDALKEAKRGAVLQPSAMMRSQIGWILYHAKRYDEAEQEYVRLIERFEKDKSPSSREILRDTRMILSNISVMLKNMPEAEEWLEQVLDEYPEDVGAQNDLGYLWADQSKNLDRALEMTQTAVAAEPANYAYLDSLGWTYYRLGRFEDALRELEKASDVEEPDGVVLDHLADVYLQLKRKSDALKTWKRALKVVDADDDAELHESISNKIKKLEAEKESD